MNEVGPPVPGLVSVTYRQLSADEIVRLAVECELEVVEWGGDVHVPVGDLAEAERVAGLCADAGLRTCSYGSYYRAGHEDLEAADLVVRTAARLGAPNIRIWAGESGSAECRAEQRRQVADDIAGFSALAAEAGMQVSLEFHRDTLTDTLESTLRLLDEIGTISGVVRPYWQPAAGPRVGEARRQVDALLPLLRTVHVFAWTEDGDRKSLRTAAPLWQDIMDRLARATADDGLERYALLEFVRGDDPAELPVESATLRDWLSALDP